MSIVGSRPMQTSKGVEKQRSRRTRRVTRSEDLKGSGTPPNLGEFVKDVAEIKRRLRVLETSANTVATNRIANVAGSMSHTGQAEAQPARELAMDKLLSLVDQLELFVNQKESPRPSPLIRDAWNRLDD
jgi:hypothetical protein